MEKNNKRQLPNLLYVGDVPVEKSYHGSALLYRLLQTYPPEKLLIIEGNLHPSRPDRRLSSVRYESLRVGWPRLLHTRFSRAYGTWLTLTAASRMSRLTSLISGFKPQAVLTVTHGYSWITACNFARRRGLPSHLVLHDDWVRLAPIWKMFKPRLECIFSQVYSWAASRLCVSPGMEQIYQRRYGVCGTVMYPSRSASDTKFSSPPNAETNRRPFTVAYGGTLNTQDYYRSLGLLADCLVNIGGRLLIFGPDSLEILARNGLNQPNIVHGGLLQSNVLIEELRKEADLMFLPISFEPDDREAVQIFFPSKLTDYTATGLPILIFSPCYCSAVRWAAENPGVAEVITNPSREALEFALNRLVANPRRRKELGQKALTVGAESFTHSKIFSKFIEALTSKTNTSLV